MLLSIKITGMFQCFFYIFFYIFIMFILNIFQNRKCIFSCDFQNIRIRNDISKQKARNSTLSVSQNIARTSKLQIIACNLKTIACSFSTNLLIFSKLFFIFCITLTRNNTLVLFLFQHVLVTDESDLIQNDVHHK